MTNFLVRTSIYLGSNEKERAAMRKNQNVTGVDVRIAALAKNIRLCGFIVVIDAVCVFALSCVINL